MDNLDNRVHQSLTEHLELMKSRIAQKMAELKRNASGRSVSSLTVVLEGMNKGYLEGAAQWEVMQQGRAKGKGPYNFREIIREWITNKGISIRPRGNESQESALNSAAYLITRSILSKGTALYRSQGYDDVYDSVVNDEFNKLDHDIGAFFEADIDETNSLFIKG